MRRLEALWRGDLPPGEAFWTWAVTVGLLLNISTSILSLLLLSLEQPLPALLVGYGISVPYNLVASFGVWRSAARYEGPEFLRTLARGATVIIMTFLSLT